MTAGPPESGPPESGPPESGPPESGPPGPGPAGAGPGIDGSGTARAVCVLAPNPSPMTLDGTNTWLIGEPGSDSVAVVDPGPDDAGHLDRITGRARAAGQRITRILLTHGHADHSAGAARLARQTGAPVLAADPAYRLGAEGLHPGGAVLAGGTELRVIATPGHTADSVCLQLAADGALLTGDTVLGRGTTVIAEDGSLADYLRSLDALRALAGDAPDGAGAGSGGLSVLLPGHGPLLPDPAGTLDYYLAHRAERLAEIRAAIEAGDRSAGQIVARVYAAVDRSLWPSATWSVRAQLDYLASREKLPPDLTW